jgi:hypothetical protein
MSTTDLPRFSVTAIQSGRGSGRFEPSPLIGEHWIGCIYVGDGKFLWGRFVAVDHAQHTCDFQPDDPTAMCLLRAGGSYPYLDGYWGERAELVLDPERTWREAEFQLADAVQVPSAQGVLWTRSSEAAPAGGDLVPDGWDHEHCSICWEKIGRGGAGVGFVSGADDWVCVGCYHRYVASRSLAFVNWQTGYDSPSGS